jgi:hypothetical protein
MTATFQQETLAQAWPDAQALFRLHYEELTFGKERIELAPDVGRYEALERDGGLLVFTARDGGALVAYAAFFLMPHAHYRHNLFALNDVFYTDPARRGDRWLGFRFIRWIDERLCADGDIDAIKWHVKVHRDFGPALRRLGYVPEEVIWSKVQTKSKA